MDLCKWQIVETLLDQVCSLCMCLALQPFAANVTTGQSKDSIAESMQEGSYLTLNFVTVGHLPKNDRIQNHEVFYAK